MLNKYILLIVIILIIFMLLLFIVCYRRNISYYGKNSFTFYDLNMIQNKNYSKLSCSVIIPCIPTHVKFLKNMVYDISKQTRKPDNIIIALSETTDIEGKQLQNQLQLIFNKTHVFPTIHPQKSWDNRDRGAVLSDSDVYCFLDADDRVHPQRIEFGMRACELHNAEYVFCNFTRKRENFKLYENCKYITGEDVYNNEKKYNENQFKIILKHFNTPVNYSTGMPFVTRKLWWKVGGQTLNVINHPEVIEKNGVGEDIVFTRVILSKLPNKSHFILIDRPLLYKEAASQRNETHWKTNKPITHFPKLTLPQIKKMIYQQKLQSVKNVPQQLWLFWWGPEMSSNRLRGLDLLKKNIGVETILVTKNNLNKYIHPDYPIHPAFEYLSAVHKSDYIRVYLLHLYGGGWHDIKPMRVSWKNSWNQFDNPDVWVISQPEIKGYGAKVYTECGKYIPDLWKDLAVNGYFIWRPLTLFSENCFNDLHKKLDQFLPELKKHTATSPRCKKGENGYPMDWALFGSIHSPNVYKFRNNIIKNLPKEDRNFRGKNYR